MYWLRNNYIVEGQRSDYDGLVIDLCQVYTAYHSTTQQYVVLPPYARTQQAIWARSTHPTHRLLKQQPGVVPKDYECERRLGVNAPRDPYFDFDDRVVSTQAIEGRKLFLPNENVLNP